MLLFCRAMLADDRKEGWMGNADSMKIGRMMRAALDLTIER